MVIEDRDLIDILKQDLHDEEVALYSMGKRFEKECEDGFEKTHSPSFKRGLIYGLKWAIRHLELNK